MALVEINGRTYPTLEGFPSVGDTLENGCAVDSHFRDVLLSEYQNKPLVLNIFPSIDTPTCSASVKKFNEVATQIPNVKVVCVSADLPFAQKRFCDSFSLGHVQLLSTFRGDFGRLLGVEIAEGPMRGLMSRAVLVVDEKGIIQYAEHVRDLLNTAVNYNQTLKVLSNLSRSFMT